MTGEISDLQSYCQEPVTELAIDHLCQSQLNIRLRERNGTAKKPDKDRKPDFASKPEFLEGRIL